MKTYFSIENNYYDINSSFKQTFHHTPSKKVDVSSLIRAKVESDEQISELDLKILKVLDKMKFATANLLARELEITIEKVERRLNKLIKNKIINSFLLAQIKYLSKDEIPNDVQYIYTMDYAGSELLNHFVASYFEEWQTKDACLNSEAISKILISNEFCVKVKERLKEKVKNVIIEPQYPIDKYMLTSNFEIEIEKEDESKIFLGQVIGETYDRYNIIKQLEKLENFISTEGYNKLYGSSHEEPVLMFICANEDIVAQVAETIENLFVKIKIYRLTTMERLAGDLADAGTFIRYDRVQGGLKTSAMKLFKVN